MFLLKQYNIKSNAIVSLRIRT